MAAMTSRNANSYSFHTKLQSFVNVAEARNPANGLHTTATSSKLSVFIVCRFEKLTNEDQNLLRSASIIGLEFTRDILYGILSPKMRTHMFNSLQSLIKNQWLKEKKPGADEYRFVHPLLYQTLYDLTPASDKGRLHSLIASYIEDAYDGNPQHFAQLGYHYGMSKECRPKAVEYYVRAAVHVLESGLDAYDEGLELLGQAGLYADSAFDYGAILGVIMEAREHVAATKKQMQKAILAAKEPPQDGKTDGDSKEGGGWRSWKFLTVGRSRKAVPAEDAVDVHEAALSAGNLTLEQVSESVRLCAIVGRVAASDMH
jgi:predicted ATPase